MAWIVDDGDRGQGAPVGLGQLPGDRGSGQLWKATETLFLSVM